MEVREDSQNKLNLKASEEAWDSLDGQGVLIFKKSEGQLGAVGHVYNPVNQGNRGM